MATPSIETVRAWLGRVMIDGDGHRIGEITDIYLDNETGRPEWAVVRTGLFGLRSTLRRSPRPPMWATRSRCAMRGMT